MIDGMTVTKSRKATVGVALAVVLCALSVGVVSATGARSAPTAGRVVPSTRSDWRTNFFVSPSGNIVCGYFGDNGGALLCYTRNNRNLVSLGKHDRAYFFPHDGSIAGLAAHHGPVLHYGDEWTLRPFFLCQSEFVGMTCTNASGHGFEIDRTRVHAW